MPVQPECHADDMCLKAGRCTGHQTTAGPEAEAGGRLQAERAAECSSGVRHVYHVCGAVNGWHIAGTCTSIPSGPAAVTSACYATVRALLYTAVPNMSSLTAPRIHACTCKHDSAGICRECGYLTRPHSQQAPPSRCSTCATNHAA